MVSPMKFAPILLILLMLTACGSSEQNTPEDRVKATLEAIESAAEERSLSGVMDHISEQYQDHQGNTKKDIARLVQFQIIRNQKISAFTLIRSLEINDDFAAVELSAAMSGREELSNEKDILKADAYRFSIVLADEDGDWRVRSVSWDRGW